MTTLIIVSVVIVVLTILTYFALTWRPRDVPPAETPPEAAPPPSTSVGTATLERAPPAEPDVLPTVEVPPPADTLPSPTVAETVEVPAPPAGRLIRLRDRLSRSQSTLGRGLLSLLSRDVLDEATWEEVEETLLAADVGVAATRQIVDALRTRARVLGARTPDHVRTMLRDELVTAVGLADRTLHVKPHDGRPAVVLVVGVNGTGKTTTCGKLARVLIADRHSVVLGAADTFRAAAADQLQTWAERVGAEVVRGPEGGDPASVAFDAVSVGLQHGKDVVVIDTAGRLHTKQGLMDELAKVKRVVEKQASIDEVLLVLDATTGQNGVIQARVFTEAVDVTGLVLTKLDGTAKGGIVIAVQRDLGVPVKLVGLGEGPDDLAPFEPEAFVDGVLGISAGEAAISRPPQ